MQTLVERLCSPECAGRAPGTKGGDAARAVVMQAFPEAGLDPDEKRDELRALVGMLEHRL